MTQETFSTPSTPSSFSYLFPQLCSVEDRLGAWQQRDFDSEWEVQQPATSFSKSPSVPELERQGHSDTQALQSLLQPTPAPPCSSLPTC